MSTLSVCFICFLILASLLGFTPYVHAVGAVEDGLVGYWSLDQDTIDEANQLVNGWGGLVATIHGDPQLAPAEECVVGECMLFDGDIDRLFVEDTDPPVIDRDWDAITLECWANIVALDDSWNRIISLDNMPANTATASLYYDDDDNRHNFWIRGEDGNTDAAADDIAEDIPLEQWLHLAGTYDGNTARYYIDGELANEYALKAGTIAGGGLFLSIGDRSDGCNCDAMQGYVDEVRIYERALSGQEVLRNSRSSGLAVWNSRYGLSVLWGKLKSVAQSL